MAVAATLIVTHRRPRHHHPHRAQVVVAAVVVVVVVVVAAAVVAAAMATVTAAAVLVLHHPLHLHLHPSILLLLDQPGRKEGYRRKEMTQSDVLQSQFCILYDTSSDGQAHS